MYLYIFGPSVRDRTNSLCIGLLLQYLSVGIALVAVSLPVGPT